MSGYEATALDGLPGIAPLKAACADPVRAARSALRSLLGPAGSTAFAREHGFDGRIPLETFRATVPIRSCADHAPWIDRALAGEPDVLFAGPTVLVARTTGTTGKPKLLPLPRASIRAFREIQAWWGAAFVRDHPEITLGRWLSLVFPRRLETGSDGIDIGTVPGLGVGHAGAVEGRVDELPTWIHATETDPEGRLRGMVAFAAGRDLSVIGAPLPTLSLALLDGLASAGSGLCDAVDPARAELLRRVFAEDGRFSARRVWPRLRAVVAWRSGPSARYLPRLSAHLGGLPVREVGYAATEGQFSVALWPGVGGALLAATHYLLELVPDGVDVGPATETLLPSEAEVGAAYRLIVTTPAGLHRYDTEDVVTVVGRVGRLPVVVFSHRVGVYGFAGERVTEPQLCAAVRAGATAVGARIVDFVGRAVGSEPPFWQISVVVDGAVPPSLSAAIDRALQRENELYARRRGIGALGPVEVRVTTDLGAGPKCGHV